MLAYLTYMAERLEEMHRLLKPTGCVYLHCNQFASHYLKILMDAIFGPKNFINEIIWNYGTPSGGRAGGKKPVKTHDCLLVYAKKYGAHLYNKQFTPYSDSYLKWFRHTDDDGRQYRTRSRKGNIHRQYLDESPGNPLSTVWSDIMQNYGKSGWFPTTQVGTKYPTEKPLDLLERILDMSSNPDDLVLDPFCGCGTTIEAAKRKKRRWIGIDISAFAVDLVRNERLMDKDIPAYGIPTDMASAHKLVSDRPFEFESWAITRLPGFVPNTKQRGDGGVDGRGKLAVLPNETESTTALAQAKGGKTFSIDSVRAFASVMDQENAAIGYYVTMKPVTSPSALTLKANMGKVTVGVSQYPKFNFWSVSDYFEGNLPHMPPMNNPYTGEQIHATLF